MYLTTGLTSKYIIQYRFQPSLFHILHLHMCDNAYRKQQALMCCRYIIVKQSKRQELKRNLLLVFHQINFTYV